jgi:hypothetical protein
MSTYRSPENPNIFIIPPRKRSQKEINDSVQRELEESMLREELLTLYQEISKYHIRLEEVQRIQTLLELEANELRGELETAEARKCELERIFKG